jgi:hypothetical protein
MSGYRREPMPVRDIKARMPTSKMYARLLGLSIDEAFSRRLNDVNNASLYRLERQLNINILLGEVLRAVKN